MAVVNLNAEAVRLARAWKLVRKDGGTLRLTDSSSGVEVLGELYSPLYGFQVTSRENSFGQQSLEMQGLIDDSTFGYSDMIANRFDSAVIIERVVDWKYPWKGAVRPSSKFWMGTPDFNSETFTAPLEDITRYLRRTRSSTVGPICPLKLFETGDGKCNADPTGKSYPTLTVGVVTDRQTFQMIGSVVPGGFPENRFADGKLVWITGLNSALVSNVKMSDTSVVGAYELMLHNPMPFDIDVGDTFSLEWGCDRTEDNCGDLFDNIENFGGEPHIPGSDTAANIELFSKKKP